MGCNVKLDGFVAVIVIVAAVGTSHYITLIACFVVLHRTEDRLIKGTQLFYVIVHYYGVMRGKYIVWLQQLVYGKINGTYIYAYIFLQLMYGKIHGTYK